MVVLGGKSLRSEHEITSKHSEDLLLKVAKICRRNNPKMASNCRRRAQYVCVAQEYLILNQHLVVHQHVDIVSTLYELLLHNFYVGLLLLNKLKAVLEIFHFLFKVNFEVVFALDDFEVVHDHLHCLFACRGLLIVFNVVFHIFLNDLEPFQLLVDFLQLLKIWLLRVQLVFSQIVELNKAHVAELRDQFFCLILGEINLKARHVL